MLTYALTVYFRSGAIGNFNMRAVEPLTDEEIENFCKLAINGELSMGDHDYGFAIKGEDISGVSLLRKL